MAAYPVAPDLVSNFPKFDAKWSRVTIGCTHRTVFRGCWSIAVFNPRCGFIRGRAASLDVDSNRSLSSKLAGEHDKLICTKVARLRFVLPREIGPRDTLVTRSDSPEPAIILGHVTTRPANKSRL